ncbi:endonuclease domain-containing protein [Candidatus Margulisiibacteriota bacterium]
MSLQKLDKRDFSKILREQQTKEEATVWQVLRNRKYLGLKFRRQHIIRGYVVDFYCHELQLAIEIDGGIHNLQKDYDSFRQEAIEKMGIRFIRVSNRMINSNFSFLLQQIKEVRTDLHPNAKK